MCDLCVPVFLCVCAQRMEALGLIYTAGTLEQIKEADNAIGAATEACLHGTIEMCRTCVAVAEQLVKQLDARSSIEMDHIKTLRCV